MKWLTAENGFIFRITHVQNLRWIFRHGLQCRTASTGDPGFIQIGNPDVIDRRVGRRVLAEPGGVLEDYVAFYFTPLTPMLYNIKTGFQTRQWAMSEIAIIVAKVPDLLARGHRVVIADRNAALAAARFSDAGVGLETLPWALWRARDFKRDPEAPDKVERYMAEALVHKAIAPDGVAGVMCYDKTSAEMVSRSAAEMGLTIDIKFNKKWFFG